MSNKQRNKIVGEIVFYGIVSRPEMDSQVTNTVCYATELDIANNNTDGVVELQPKAEKGKANGKM